MADRKFTTKMFEQMTQDIINEFFQTQNVNYDLQDITSKVTLPPENASGNQVS